MALINWKQIGFLLLSFSSVISIAKTIEVSAVDELQQALFQANAHDTIVLAKGEYRTHLIIEKPITLTSDSGAVIHAQDSGNAILVLSDDVTISNLTITHYGDDLTETHSGIKVKEFSNTLIKNNHFSGDGFGVYLDKSKDVKIIGNSVQGNSEMRSADRGNGIHLSSVNKVIVESNVVTQTRDGLYIINSQNNELRNNTMTDLRFGVHYMYSYSNTVSGNHSENVDVGYALMSSKYLTISDNSAVNCEDYGLLMNFVNHSTFKDNSFDRIRSTEGGDVSGDDGKALFVYNSTNNKIFRNTFSNSDLGIHLTAGSEGNEIYHNNFINNEVQVKYVSTREQEWSVGGKGNFWSNYLGWDLDQNGIGDAPFEPNDGIDKLLWKYPEAKVLMDSPAVLLLRWAQRSFPVLKSPGVKDSFPNIRKIGVL